MISFSSACHILKTFSPVLRVHTIALPDACGRVCARDIRAKEDSPAFHKSQRDGFAVRSREAVCGAVLPVTGYAFAGKPFRGFLTSGTCVGIATGAELPRGADAVIRKEDVQVKDGRIYLFRPAQKNDFVLSRGRECIRGARLLSQGTCLGPAQVGLLASQGIFSLAAYRPPAVSILATGSELAGPAQSKPRGCIYDASSPMLASWIRRMGLQPVVLGPAGDEPDGLRKKIRRALMSDVLIVTGGVSVGDKDFIPQILRQEGVVCRFHTVALKPGKPIWFGTKGSKRIFALPGNPVSAFVGFRLFVKPFLEKALGLRGDLVFSRGFLSRPVSNADPRLAFLPCRLEKHEGRTRICPLKDRGSSDLVTLARAEGLFLCDPLSKKRGNAAALYLSL